MRGTIKRLHSDKGFGFIHTPEGDVFFHRSGLANGVSFDSLREGEGVEFDHQESAKGPRAVNVERA